MSLYDFTVNSLAGKPQPLADYRGKVALIVNVASECGYTPQYAGLERLYEAYRERGLVVLGFPSNQFGGQEPGTAEEIQSFCSLNYGVKFPLFEKGDVSGATKSPLYQFLTAKHKEPKWNFAKYVVGKDGEVRQSFSHKVNPESTEIVDAVEAALAED